MMINSVLKYKKAHQRLILLDYDGTLVDFSVNPDDAVPSNELIDTLLRLHSDTATTLIILTGRDHKSIDHLLGQYLPLDIIAEHSGMAKINGVWSQVLNQDATWKNKLFPLFNEIATECPGSFIENKIFSCTWHYRGVEEETGRNYADKLIERVTPFLNAYNLRLLKGKKVIEVGLATVNKGISIPYLLSRKNYDFILSIGDDATDEDVFKVLTENENAVTVKVGRGETLAKWQVDTPKDVLFFLQQL